MRHKTVQTDILVVGAGAAACLAAIEARKHGKSVIMVDKGHFGHSGSTFISDGSTASIFAPGDSDELFFRDTVVGGEYVSDQRLVEILMNEQRETVKELTEYGVPFSRNPDGSISLYREFGMSVPRTPDVDGGGPGFLEPVKRAVKDSGVEVVEQTMIYRLIADNRSVVGALGFDIRKESHILYRANAIVLCTGSCTAIFPWTTAWLLTTGDGYGMAFRAGAELISMEFLEFNPILAPHGKPMPSGGTKPLFAAGGKLYNKSGERFMTKYDPVRFENTTRAILSLAIFKEIREGRGPIWLDPKSISNDEWARLERIQGTYATNYLNRLKSLGIDYRNEPIEWFSPTILCFLGGVRVNTNFESVNIKRLFAAGEACGGAYGADRIGAMLTWAAVSGKCAGREASHYSDSGGSIHERNIEEAISDFEQFAQRKNGVSPDEIKKKIKKVANTIGPIRNGRDLQEAIKELQSIAREEIPTMSVAYKKDLVSAQEAANLCLVAEMVARSALMRTETRGQHVREDYPHKDNVNWLKWIVLHQSGAEMVLSTTDIPFAEFRLRPSG